MENIVITGIGIVSPLGIGKEEFWENDLSGKSKISICEDMVNNHMSSRTSSKINDDKLEKYLDSLDEELLSNQSRFAKIAYIAAQEAISDSQLDNYYNKNKIGVIGSSAIGGTPEIQKTYEYLTNNGKDELIYKDVGEEFYNHGMFNYPATVISKHYNFTGISTSLSTGCTAGMDALITGLQLLNQNELDAVVVGSAESPLCTLTYSTLNAIGALSTWTGDPRESSRPFDQKRCGFVISEASAYLVLERETLAKKRNAKIYGKIKGVASLCNAEHMTDLKNPTVLSEVIRQTLAKSTLTPEQIDYINAHGSSTLQNDKCESEAINNIDNVLKITNNVKNWPNLFMDYTNVDIIEEQNNYVKFKLFMKDGNQEISWISERITNPEDFTVIGRRLDPKFPFEFMNLEWQYQSLNENTTQLTWIQNFEPSKQLPPHMQSKLINHLSEHSPIELDYLNNQYEKYYLKK